MNLWRAGILGVMAAGFLPGWGEAADRGAGPNILVILADDQGWGDLGAQGNRQAVTPHLDRLAGESARFDRFFVQPVCSPTRAEFLTGRYHPRGGVFDTSRGGERLAAGVATLGDVFRSAGYATALVGKWHSGQQWPYHPNARGFDYFYGFCSGHLGQYFDPVLEENGRRVKPEGYVADILAEQAMMRMEAEAGAGRPFFLVVTFNTPHSPMQVEERWWREFEERDLPQRGTEAGREDLAHTRAALAMNANLDWNVGRMLGKLDELAIAGETIVVYFSDNGPNGHRWNGGMRGVKGSTDEGGVRSPLLVRWPGKIAPQEVKGIAGAIDLLPTLAGLAGKAHLVPEGLDGVNLAAVLREPGQETAGAGDRLLFAHWNGRVSVRSQRYRLDAQGRLYDLVADPGQERDVAAEQPERAGELRAAVEAWKREVIPADFGQEAPFTVGHPGCAATPLPAQDAVAVGGTKRSNRFPNDSFFLDWKAPGDGVSWPVEVVQGGRFVVDVWYACAEADLGATLELRCGEAVARGTLDEPWDPPLVGPADDRIPRQESPVKDFRTWRLGEIALAPGRGELRLTAVAVPGRQALECAGLVLTRVGGKGANQ